MAPRGVSGGEARAPPAWTAARRRAAAGAAFAWRTRCRSVASPTAFDSDDAFRPNESFRCLARFTRLPTALSAARRTPDPDAASCLLSRAATASRRAALGPSADASHARNAAAAADGGGGGATTAPDGERECIASSAGVGCRSSRSATQPSAPGGVLAC